MKTIVEFYKDILAEIIIDPKAISDIVYYRTRDIENVKAQDFLSEVAWVILNSGMKNSVVDGLWTEFTVPFSGFNPQMILGLEHENGRVLDVVRKNALDVFANERKVDAIIEIINRVHREGWVEMKRMIYQDGVDYLETLPMIGPVTKFHLGKNLGIDCVKPDRHLVRMSEKVGFESPEEMCLAVQKELPDRLSVIDYVFWKFAESNPDYLDRMEGVTP